MYYLFADDVMFCYVRKLTIVFLNKLSISLLVFIYIKFVLPSIKTRTLTLFHQ